jgi:hypothetical protein
MGRQSGGSGTFMDRLIRAEGHLVHKIKARDLEGRPSYYLVHVRPDREQMFLAALQEHGPLQLEDYGTVIGSCFGEQPSPALIAEMRARYGFEL